MDKRTKGTQSLFKVVKNYFLGLFSILHSVPKSYQGGGLFWRCERMVVNVCKEAKKVIFIEEPLPCDMKNDAAFSPRLDNFQVQPKQVSTSRLTRINFSQTTCLENNPLSTCLLYYTYFTIKEPKIIKKKKFFLEQKSYK